MALHDRVSWRNGRADERQASRPGLRLRIEGAMVHRLRMRELLTVLAVCASAGCVKYQYYDPTPVGTFYPGSTQTVRARHASGKGNGTSRLAASVGLTIRGPVRVVAFGSATYYDENAGIHEVARIKGADEDYFVWTDSLRAFGRFEITGSQEAWGLLSPITRPAEYLLGSYLRLLLLGGLIVAGALLWRGIWSLWL